MVTTAFKRIGNSEGARKRTRRLGAIVAASLFMGISAAGCSAPASNTDSASGDNAVVANYKSKGITMGIAAEPPSSMLNDAKEPVGLFPDTAKQVLKDMGITNIKVVVTDFGSLIPGLQSGQFDMIAGGLWILPKRCSAVSFANPEVVASDAFAVKKGNPLKVSTYEEIAKNDKVRLGVVSGSAMQTSAKGLGVPDSQVQVFPSVNDLLDALRADRIDAGAYDNISLGWAIKDDKAFELTEPYVPVVNGAEQTGYAAIAFKKDQPELADAYNKALQKVRDTKEYQAVAPEYGAIQKNFDMAKAKTATDLCNAK